MKKISLLLIGLLVMSIVVMSGCADKKSYTSISTEENSSNVSNSTMPPEGESPGNMSSNDDMPQAENPGDIPFNSTMLPEGNPGNNSSMPLGGVPPAGNPGEMQNSTNESQ